jgi:hypothetical protein
MEGFTFRRGFIYACVCNYCGDVFVVIGGRNKRAVIIPLLVKEYRVPGMGDRWQG